MVNSNLKSINFGDFVSSFSDSEALQLTLAELEIGSYYELTVYSTRVNCAITSITGADEAQNVRISVWGARSLFLANFKATAESATITFNATGQIGYILRKIT